MKQNLKFSILKYSQSKVIPTGNNSKNLSAKLIVNIEDTLRYHDFRTKVDGTSIEFERITRSIQQTGMKRDYLKNLRTGRINIIIRNKNIIEIKTIFSLSHLTFLTLFLGLCIFLLGWYYNSNLLGIGIFSILVMIVTFLLGWLNAISKIDRIIEIAKKNT